MGDVNLDLVASRDFRKRIVIHKHFSIFTIRFEMRLHSGYVEITCIVQIYTDLTYLLYPARYYCYYKYTIYTFKSYCLAWQHLYYVYVLEIKSVAKEYLINNPNALSQIMPLLWYCRWQMEELYIIYYIQSVKEVDWMSNCFGYSLWLL